MKASAVILTLAITTASQAQTFTQVVAFGDSLSDIGNVSSSTFGFSPGSGYYSGRFSNGPVWIENVNSSYSLPTLTRSTSSGGKDYAYGGVKTGTGNTSYFPFSFPNIGPQISNYLGSNTANASTLYSVWGGGNDLMDNLSVNTQTIVNNLVSHVTTLSNAGARFIIVPNLPLLGEIPKYRTTANRTAYNNLTSTFNTQLASAMTTLDASLPAKIYQVNVEQMFTEVLANPSAYGFTNVTDVAYNGSSTVANPDQYLFWDNVHPTRIGHQQLASRAVDLIDTHGWIGTNGDFNAAVNWDSAGAPAGNWIASLKNSGGSPKTAILSGTASVRQVRVSSSGAPMQLSILSGSTLGVSQSASLNSVARFELSSSPGRLNTASLALSGTIELAAASGFVPLPGTTYSPLTYTSRSGSVTIVNATGFAGLNFNADYSATALILTASATPGDGNLDARVDSVDFNALVASFGATGTNWLAGDFTGDSKTNSLDFNHLAGNFGAAPALGSVVPEPTCLAFIFLSALTLRRRFAGHDE
jgi:phospholipase/lecithinase/hemolysin